MRRVRAFSGCHGEANAGNRVGEATSHNEQAGGGDQQVCRDRPFLKRRGDDRTQAAKDRPGV
jgi:hypothetical protein